MANIYVGQMKDILKNYYRQQGEYNALIETNNKRFSPEYADIENVKVKTQQERAYNDTVNKIKSVYHDARNLLAKASFPNVEQLTADQLFFQDNSGFELSVDEVNSFVERYQKNPTMLKLIQSYISKHDQPTKEHPIGKYSSVRITLPEEQVEAYRQFGEGALRVAKKIYQNGLIMKDPIELDTFADENFGRELYNIIGTGMNLSDYNSERIPENATHIFDRVELRDSDSNVYTESV